MTTRPTEERIAHLKSITLSESSRMRMREELAAYADLHTFTGTQASPAAVHSHYFSHTLSFVSGGFFRISAALVLLISMLGGTAYAANDAQPGQTLYTIKLNLTEPVQTALIPSTEGRAAWHAILAERRLEEATNLAVAGKLDTATQNTITDNFTKHVQDSSDAATQLQQAGNVTAALTVRSDLEARITAHEDILSQVVNHLALVGDATSTSQVATQNLLAVVHDSQSAVTGERLALEDSIDHTDAMASTSMAVNADTSNTDIAIATDAKVSATHVPAVPSTKALMRMSAKRAAPAESPSSNARTSEIAAILFKNSALLQSLQTGTTTASTTLNTASSTPDGTATTSAQTTTGTTAANAAHTTQDVNLK
ncbi:hypothetical protein BH11PAT2_BH11PAT2_05170 [soil metagenome]